MEHSDARSTFPSGTCLASAIFQAADALSRQAVSLSSWLQSGHRKMRISVSPPDTGKMAIKSIAAVQRQSGSSVEPASSRRSNFDMTPPSLSRKVYVYRHRSPTEFNRISTEGRFGAHCEIGRRSYYRLRAIGLARGAGPADRTSSRVACDDLLRLAKRIHSGALTVIQPLGMR